MVRDGRCGKEQEEATTLNWEARYLFWRRN
jgi:hypothetical protein